MEQPIFKDKAGYELKPGDLIVYGHNLDRCASIQYGLVLDVKWGQTEQWDYVAKDFVKIAKLTVQGVDTNWRGEPPKLLRKGTLAFPDRVLRVYPEQVPEEVRKLLGVSDESPGR